MGELFRCYWMPALLAEELPENDCPPVRVKLLGERLLAFRDCDGRYGLIDEFCAHRGVSLWFGRNEQGGLRCPYHGWKYDVTGQCIEVPSEPAESGYCNKIKLKILSADQDRRRPVDLYGPGRERAAASRMGVRAGAARADLHLQALAGMQLAAGHGRRHRFQPRLLAALAAASNSDPLFKGARGNKYNLNDKQALLRSRRQPTAASTSARAATPRKAITTGASRRG